MLKIRLSFLLCFQGTLYIPHFSSSPGVNNNQTIVVDYIEETAQGSLTAYKGKRNSKLFSHWKTNNLFLFF